MSHACRSVLLLSAMAAVCFGIVLEFPGYCPAEDQLAWKKPFRPDRHTVALYHFDEGRGNEALDAGGDAAQFSVSTRLTGDVMYGVNNFLGFGNFFGQIGEIRISNKRRY